MKWCTKCVYPNTRPDLTFDEDGVCDACRSAEERDSIDWDAREKELREVLERFKGKGSYDCIVPVSGGKDSTFQVKTLLDYGMRPLAVTFTACDSTEEGKHNLENIAEIGVDHIVIRPNRKLYKYFFREAFSKIGDACWPCHTGIFTSPIKLAVVMNIPLVVYGENPQDEYGGPLRGKAVMDPDWLRKYGGLNDLMVEDWLKEGITKEEIFWYLPPSDEDLKKAEIMVLYLGHFLKWDARKQLEISKSCGFIERKERPRGSILQYENVDCKFVDMHDHLMYRKFGFGRATTQVSIDIRNGKTIRDNAKLLADTFDSEEPDIKAFSEYTGLTEEEIRDNIDKNTNWNLFDENLKLKEDNG